MNFLKYFISATLIFTQTAQATPLRGIRTDLQDELVKRAAKNGIKLSITTDKNLNASSEKNTLDVQIPEIGGSFKIEAERVNGTIKELKVTDLNNEHLPARNVYVAQEMKNISQFTGELISNNISDQRTQYLLTKVEENIKNIGRKILSYSDSWNEVDFKYSNEKELENERSDLMGNRFVSFTSIVMTMGCVALVTLSGLHLLNGQGSAGLSITFGLTHTFAAGIGLSLLMNTLSSIPKNLKKIQELTIKLKSEAQQKSHQSKSYIALKSLISTVIYNVPGLCSGIFRGA